MFNVAPIKVEAPLVPKVVSVIDVCFELNVVQSMLPRCPSVIELDCNIDIAGVAPPLDEMGNVPVTDVTPPPVAFSVVPVSDKLAPRIISSITPVPEVPLPTNLLVVIEVLIVPVVVIGPPDINPEVEIDVTVAGFAHKRPPTLTNKD